MCFEQVKAKINEIFMCDFILFLNNKIRAISKLQYMRAFSLLFSIELAFEKVQKLWKGEKMSITSIFSFLPQCF